MKRQSRGAVLDISIRGDELEHNRIQLEHNLQNTDLSFHLSSTSDDENHNNEYNHHHHRNSRRNHSSVEYPRHISEPSLVDFPSFAHRSREHLREDDQHPMHAWSYRSGEDEEGISPYGGQSLSTAAHHASAITINTGLGGARAARRDPSLSGAEYDPERPLHAMIAGVNSKHSMFAPDPSKKNAVENMTYDPLIVDSTAELDRILASGHAPPPPMSSRSIHPTPPSSSVSSDSDGGRTERTRLKLADHLRHESFSPKRPRSAQASTSHNHRPVDNQDASMNVPTPRPTRRANVVPSRASSPAQPEVRLQPATPSTTGSQFTRMARGINREIEATQKQLKTASSARHIPASGERNPFYDIKATTSQGNIHLPDVTGLTSAVESPGKPGTQYRPYFGDNKPRDMEARFLQILTSVQNQLENLRLENSISRRRVRELEMELDVCKREVAKERTRLFEREESDARQYMEHSRRGGIRNKGKGKATEGPPETDEHLHARYTEAVEEEKALEALINSLRSHLTRLTSELASHQELLTELRKLRESDAQALKDKGAEITQLREEVQRLAGEVEVLRGVVEEGLNERRTSRESHVETVPADVSMSQDLEEDEGSEQDEVPEQSEDDTDEDEDEKDEPGWPSYDSIPMVNDPPHVNKADRTMRTDYATIGSSNLAGSVNRTPRFVDAEELDNIAAEMDERRSNRSNGSITSRNRPAPSRRNDVDASIIIENPQAPALDPLLQPQTSKHPDPLASRPPAPTPGHAKKHYAGDYHESDPETPFPRIRGPLMERLFFSAPEHNAKTCANCHRSRYRTNVHSPSRPHAKPAASHPLPSEHCGELHKDEGYEGSDVAEVEHPAGDKGKKREYIASSENAGHWQKAGHAQGIPPQTVLARHIRELEDDFIHYKSIFVELTDQYKVMDAASDVRRRKLLANHIREVVDILEQKGDQITDLYNLLEFKDKPISESVVPEKMEARHTPWV